MKSIIHNKVVLFSVLITLIFGSVANAQQTMWTGNIDSNWSDPGNWNNGVPTENKLAVIGNFSQDNAPVIQTSTSIKGLSMPNFGRAYSVEVADGVTLNMQKLTMASSGDPADIYFNIGNATVSIQEEITINGKISVTTGSLTALGGIHVTGHLEAQNGTIIVGATGVPADFSTQGNSAAVNLDHSDLTIYGSAELSTKTFDITSGNISVSEDFDLMGNFTFNLNQASLEVLGNMNVGNGSSFYAGSGNIETGGDFMLNGNANFYLGSAQMLVAGESTFTASGMFDAGSGNIETGGDFMLNGNANFYLGSAQMLVAGESAFTAGGMFDAGSGTLEMQDNVEFSGGIEFYPGTSTSILNGTFTMTEQGDNNVTFFDLIVAEASDIIAGLDVLVERDMYAYGDYEQINGTTLNVVGQVVSPLHIDSPNPYLISLEVLDDQTLRAVFNQPLAQSSAENKANFAIHDGLYSNTLLLDPISTNPVLQGENNNVLIITTDNRIEESVDWVLWIKGTSPYNPQNPENANGLKNVNGKSVTFPNHKKKFVKDFVVWTGEVNSSWTASGNWSYNGPGGYPDTESNIDIRFSPNSEADLILPHGVSVKNIVNSSSKNLVLNGNELGVRGEIKMDGQGKIVTTEPGSTIIMKGEKLQKLPQNIFHQNKVNNLVIDNNGEGVQLEGDLEINGILTLTNGQFDVNGKNLVLKSTEEKMAMLGPVENGAIIGNVTVERHIPALRAFRFVSPAVTTSTSIHDNWQEGATSYTDNPKPGYGTHITGTLNDQTNGFDYTPSGNPSLFVFDNNTQSWGPIANTDQLPLIAGKAYRLMVRGDRSVDVTDNETVPTNTILRSTGTLATGNETLELNGVAGTFNFVGNPYQAIVDMNDVLANSTNLNPNYYFVWDPYVGERGAYVTVDLEDGGNNAIDASEANRYLQPGQAFFVTTAIDGAATIKFEEADKDVNADITQVFKAENQTENASIKMQLYEAQAFVDGGPLSDGLRITFSADGDNDVLLNDATKLGNLDETFCVVNGNNYLSIEKRAFPVDGEILPLYSAQYRHTNYTLRVEVSGAMNNMTAYLQDNYLDIQTELPTGISSIDFNVDETISESIAYDRFSIVFAENNLSSEDPINTNGYSVYPNPSTDGRFFVSTTGISGEEVKIALYDLLGRQVYTSDEIIGANNTAKIETANLVPGVYVVELNHNGTTFSEKVIVQ